MADGTGDFKSSDDLVCQILACLVKLLGYGKIALPINVNC